jgi:hypothetical protein
VNEHDTTGMTDTTGTTAVFDALRASLDGVTMAAPAERIEAAGRRRRNRRRVMGTAAAAAAVALGIGAPLLAGSSSSPPSAAGGGTHVQTAAYTLDTKADGTIHVTWDKGAYFTDHAGLQKALRDAGFPVLVKEGEFCKGPHDSGKLAPSGVGPGVTSVMRGESAGDGHVTFVFTPAAMPRGKQLFIGYLNPAQLASVHGNPGSVERLVPTGVPLICTATPPPEHHRP